MLIFLSGCFTNDAGQVTVVEKSFNKVKDFQQTTKVKTNNSNSNNKKNEQSS